MLGVLMIFGALSNAIGEFFFVLLFFNSLNVIINIIVFFVLLLFFYVFTENRIEFRNSAVLLLFNCPNLFFLHFNFNYLKTYGS